MGTWSAEILGNDDGSMLYNIFERMYFKKINTDEIKEKIKNDFYLYDKSGKPVLYDNTNRWLAYTQICWECSCLDEINFSTTQKIINEKIDLTTWEKEDREERIAVLNAFWKQINKKAKKKIKPKVFELIPKIAEGDCVVFKHEDGLYGGAVCFEVKKGREDYPINSYLLGITRIYQNTKPTVQDFIESHLFVSNYYHKIKDCSKKNDKNRIKICYSYTGEIKSIEELEAYQNQLSKLDVVGNIPIIPKNPTKIESYWLCFELGAYLEMREQIEWENEYPNAKDLSMPIKRYLK